MTEQDKAATIKQSKIGIELTETNAMLPAASVSGIYLAHPAARYFSLGRVAHDQVVDYAGRKGASGGEVERWLGPILNYIPGPKAEAAE